jgi:hypothetical protein
VKKQVNDPMENLKSVCVCCGAKEVCYLDFLWETFGCGACGEVLWEYEGIQREDMSSLLQKVGETRWGDE